MRASLGRYAVRIDRAVFELGSADGPRGGEGVRCRIDVRLAPTQVHSESTEASVAVALDIALARAARSIARALELGWGAGGRAAPVGFSDGVVRNFLIVDKT